MRATIKFTGDVMCAPGVTEMCTRDGVRDYSPIFRNITDNLRDCDYLVGNLETPIAGVELGFTNERFQFNSPTEFAVTVRDAGFDLVCLANNHCMDRGEEGINRTLDNLDSIGLAHTGINRKGEKRYFTVEINGIKVGFVNYTYGTNAFHHHMFLEDDLSGRVNLFQPQETLPGSIHLLESSERIGEETRRLYYEKSDEFDRYIKPHLDMLRADIADAKVETDFVIAVMHSGGQYNKEPDPYTRMLVGKLKEYGADMIVGHHPHIIHPTIIENGFLTAYSLGNLCCVPSICSDPVAAANSQILGVTLEKKDGRTVLTEASLENIETVEDSVGVPYCVYKSKMKIM